MFTLETAEDLAWLAESHGVPTDGVAIALVYGSEDCPDRVETFTANHVDCKPSVYAHVCGELVHVS